MALDDLRGHCSTFDAPVSTTYRDHTVYECPPNGQGITALMALNILEGYDIAATEPRSVEFLHPAIEAIRLAFADARAYVADPARADVPVGAMLSKEYAAERRKLIKADAAMELATAGELPGASDTVYLCARRRRRQRLLVHQQQLRGLRQLHRAARVRLQPAEPRRGLRARAGPPQRARGRQASVSHDHAGDADAARRLAVRGVRRDGRLEPAAGPHAGRDQPRSTAGWTRRRRSTSRASRSTPTRPTATSGSRTASRSRRSARWRSSATPCAQPQARCAAGSVGKGQIIVRDPETGVLWAGSDPRSDGCAIGL